MYDKHAALSDFQSFLLPWIEHLGFPIQVQYECVLKASKRVKGLCPLTGQIAHMVNPGLGCDYDPSFCFHWLEHI